MLPNMKDIQAQTMDRPPTYGFATTSGRQTLAANLKALMAEHTNLSTLIQVEQATEQCGLKIGKSTVGRLLKCETPVNLDYVEVLARIFHLDPWQLIVPGLDPKNPPTLRSVSASEEQLYARLRDLARQISKL